MRKHGVSIHRYSKCTRITGRIHRSALNRVRKFRISRIGVFNDVSVGRTEENGVESWATSMHPGQKLASIYRSGVSCRIIISRNWSRENSLLVSRTGAPVFYSVVIVYCGERKGGEREKLSPTSPRWSQDFEIASLKFDFN